MKDQNINIALFFYSLAILLISINNPFYWDNVVQISVPANYYYDTNFATLFLPSEIATGHPTFIGILFALCWKLFGKTILVSHLIMFPFIYGLVYQFFQLINNLGISKPSSKFWMLLVLLIDTTLVSQLSLLTFDVIQLFLFVLCLNKCITKNNQAFSIYFIFLLLVSLRGTIIGGGIILYHLLLNKFDISWKNYLKFVPGFLAIIIFLVSFKLSNGWVIHNIVSQSWAGSNEFSSISQLFKNLIISIWYISDYGRIGLYLILLFLGIRWFKNKAFDDSKVKRLFLIGLSQAIVLIPIIVIYQIPFGHRYFLPIIIPMSLLVVYWIDSYSKFSTAINISLIVVLLSGHLWIYPPKISQGWDSTTLHWSYIQVEELMYKYISDNNIANSEIGTFFPAYKPRKYTYLVDSETEGYSGTPFECKYLIYSNAFNLEDDVIDKLFYKNTTSWIKVKSFSSRGVEIVLFRNAEI